MKEKNWRHIKMLWLFGNTWLFNYLLTFLNRRCPTKTIKGQFPGLTSLAFPPIFMAYLFYRFINFAL